MKKLAKSDLAAAVKALSNINISPKTPFPAEEPYLSVGGVVMLGNHGFMHPEAFREMAGEEAYQELLKRPRVVTSYDLED